MTTRHDGETRTQNRHLLDWVTELAELCRPDRVYWCNGSQQEYDRLCAEMVHAGAFVRLNAEKHPSCFLARSHPSDVARVEDRTFICSLREEDAGPTNRLGDGARRGLAGRAYTFRVNWFRKDEDGRFIWPGFGDHMPRELESERELQLARLFHSPALWDLASTKRS